MGWNISSHERIQVSHTINRDPSFQQQQHQQYNDNNRNSSSWLNVYSARDGAKGSICILPIDLKMLKYLFFPDFTDEEVQTQEVI